MPEELRLIKTKERKTSMLDDVAGKKIVDERLISGRYRLLSTLGMGGMGKVWRAYDEVLKREVAVKEVRAHLDMTLSQLEQMNARLEREAWAAARIQHPNVVVIFDVIRQYDRPWIVMELIQGSSMADLLGVEGSIGLERTARIGAEVAAALGAAHRVGVLHRDVKPANVLVSHEGRVVLTDFGIAMVDGYSSLTLTGEMVGSPEFLAPERARGTQPGPASDLWALGIMLFQATEGHTPFRQGSPLMTLQSIVDEALPPASSAGHLRPIIERLLHKDPAHRLTAEQAELALRAISTPGEAKRPEISFPTHTVPFEELPEVATVGSAVAPREVRKRKKGWIIGLGLSAGVAVTLVSGVYESFAPDADSAASGEKTAASASVSVRVSGRNTTYSGDCPPSRDVAPALTATFNSDQTPDVLTYRWVTQGASVIDYEWQTLKFNKGLHIKKVYMDFSSYRRSIPLGVQVGVEIREPGAAKSNFVPVAVSCQKNY
ncbi:serine/threonine-protein kinase [Streptomyces sp. NPDC093509]|uniref:serine/threonine-protein kinase n=1 Tax=Streptomyces sp. NPDC093509 TaxID=3154982 RepID=UPI003450F728